MRGYYVPPFLRFSRAHTHTRTHTRRWSVRECTVEARSRVRGPYTEGEGTERDTIHRAFRRGRWWGGERAEGGDRNDIHHTSTAHEAGIVCIRFHAIETIPASIYNGRLLIGRWLIAVT